MFALVSTCLKTQLLLKITKWIIIHDNKEIFAPEKGNETRFLSFFFFLKMRGKCRRACQESKFVLKRDFLRVRSIYLNKSIARSNASEVEVSWSKWILCLVVFQLSSVCHHVLKTSRFFPSFIKFARYILRDINNGLIYFYYYICFLKKKKNYEINNGFWLSSSCQNN